MAFTTPQDFDLVPYVIPNVEEETNFEKFISKEEKNILIKLLGRSLYKSFIDGLAALPAVWDEDTVYIADQEVQYGTAIWKSNANGNQGFNPETSGYWDKVRDDKWLLLRDGDSYKYNGKEWQWSGMVEMLVPYIWYRWVKVDQMSLTGSGIVTGGVENSEKVNPALVMAGAWNDFAKEAGARHSQINSLYGYLQFKSDETGNPFDGTFDESFGETLSVYVNHTFKDPGLQNEWDI